MCCNCKGFEMGNRTQMNHLWGLWFSWFSIMCGCIVHPLPKPVTCRMFWPVLNLWALTKVKSARASENPNSKAMHFKAFSMQSRRYGDLVLVVGLNANRQNQEIDLYNKLPDWLSKSKVTWKGDCEDRWQSPVCWLQWPSPYHRHVAATLTKVVVRPQDASSKLLLIMWRKMVERGNTGYVYTALDPSPCWTILRSMEATS